MVEGLKNQIENFRDIGIEAIFQKAAVICVDLSIDAKFQDKRKRKIKRMPGDVTVDEHTTDAIQDFRIEMFQVLDKIISQIDGRFGVLNKLSEAFNFLNGAVISKTPASELQEMASRLALEYDQDLDENEFCSEIETLKFQAEATFKDNELADLSPLQLLNWIHSMSLQETYPNTDIALRIFLTLPVTSASCERSFSKLKTIKNYMRSTMGQERLTDIAILAIEKDVARALDYSDLIDEFASKRARKIDF